MFGKDCTYHVCMGRSDSTDADVVDRDDINAADAKRAVRIWLALTDPGASTPVSYEDLQFWQTVRLFFHTDEFGTECTCPAFVPRRHCFHQLALDLRAGRKTQPEDVDFTPLAPKTKGRRAKAGDCYSVDDVDQKVKQLLEMLPTLAPKVSKKPAFPALAPQASKKPAALDTSKKAAKRQGEGKVLPVPVKPLRCKTTLESAPLPSVPIKEEMVQVRVYQKKVVVLDGDFETGTAWSEVMMLICDELQMPIDTCQFMDLRSYLQIMPSDTVCAPVDQPYVKVGLGIRPNAG